VAAERRRRLILVALNEINFDIARAYVEPLGLAAVKQLLDGHGIRTTAEERYELLEPWIQWPSIHTGLSAAEHGIFRLGDIVASRVPQIFEQLEAGGLRVGCVSPMNAANRMRAPAYFIPDPWTQTPADDSWWSRNLASAISQAVNDNAQSHITPRSAAVLALGSIRFARPRNYGRYWSLATRSRAAPWRKALFLDLFLHDLHLRLFQGRGADFSTVFFNAGAHVQHHYFFNSPFLKGNGAHNPGWYVPPDVDPLGEMLQVYDRILADYLALDDTEVIVATGLSQRPYDRAKFYYRLRDHRAFLTTIGVRCRRVEPRMTRDFLIEFNDESEAAAGVSRLEQCCIAESGERLFGEVDNRGTSAFVTLTYPRQIDDAARFCAAGSAPIPLLPHVAFVAVKNGMHQSDGFVFATSGIHPHLPTDGAHVRSLHTAMQGFFESRQ
jgi:hypothetical protein